MPVKTPIRQKVAGIRIKHAVQRDKRCGTINNSARTVPPAGPAAAWVAVAGGGALMYAVTARARYTAHI